MVAALAARGRGRRCPRHVVRADEISTERLAGGVATATYAAVAGAQRANPQAPRRLARRPGQSRLVPAAPRPALCAPRGRCHERASAAKRSACRETLNNSRRWAEKIYFPSPPRTWGRGYG